jgi:uncharacterized membrane protein YuzA (DUF378 family)
MKGGNKMEELNTISKILVIVGALNWGLYAINPSLELVQYLQIGWLITTIYALVGLAGIYEIVNMARD